MKTKSRVSSAMLNTSLKRAKSKSYGDVSLNINSGHRSFVSLDYNKNNNSSNFNTISKKQK